MRRRTGLAVAGICVVALTGCGAVKGERVLVDDDGSSYSRADAVAQPVEAIPVPIGDDGLPVSADSTITTELAPVVKVSEADPVPAAFAFTVRSLDGDQVDGVELLERAPAIMTFVRADCDYSDDEVPKIADAAERHPDVTFVVVASGPAGPDAPWLDGIADGRDNLIVVDDTDELLWYRFAITATPSNVLVDDSGVMRSSYGALAESGLDRAAALVAAGFD